MIKFPFFTLVCLLFTSRQELLATPPDSSRLITVINVGQPLTAVDYSPDGTFVAVAGSEERIDIYHPVLGTKIKSLNNAHQDDILALRISPDSRLLASGGVDGRILIWDIASGRVIREMVGHKDYVRDLAFSPDGFFLASAGWDRRAVIWETGTARKVADLDDHPDNVTSVSFSPDGKQLITACGDHLLRIFSLEANKVVKTLSGHTDEIWDVKWSPASGVVASGAWDNKARVWNANSGHQIHVLPGHVTDVWSVAFSPDGTMLGSCGGDRTIKLWDLPTGRRIITLAEQAHDSDVEEIDFSPDGSVLASCGRDGMLKFWRVPSLEERLTSSVELAMNDWEQKGTFEKTSDYNKRIQKADKETQRVREALEKELVVFFEQNVNWESTLTISTYDADEEYFLVTSPVLGTLRLFAAPKEAKKIVDNENRIEFRDLEMNVVDGKLQVKQLKAYFRGLNRRYDITR